MSGGMNKLFVKDPWKFINTYAIAPPDDVAHYVGVKTQTMKKSGTNTEYAFSKVEPTKKIAYLNFLKGQKRERANVTFMPLAEQVATFEGRYAQICKRHVPAYFLPWSAGGAIIRLTIPKKSQLKKGDLDSDYFFTATITGCSVFIKGDPDNPTIYHAGGQTGENDPANAALFWENLMARHSHRAGGIKAKVDKREYISEPGIDGATTTQQAKDYEQFLNAQHRTDLNIQFTRPWGCVLGLRDPHGLWKFYLQRNATVFFCTLKKSHGKEVKGTTRSMALPMSVKEIFPANGTMVSLQPPMPRKI